MKSRIIISATASAIAFVIFILPAFSRQTDGFNGFWEGHPYASLIISLLAVVPPLVLLNAVYNFYTAKAGKSLAKFIAALAASYLLAGAVSIARPAFEFMLTPESHLIGWLGMIASALYVSAVAAFSFIPFAILIAKGIFGKTKPLAKAGSAAVALLLLLTVLPLAIFIIKQLWWIILIAIGILALTGFISGNSPEGWTSQQAGNGNQASENAPIKTSLFGVPAAYKFKGDPYYYVKITDVTGTSIAKERVDMSKTYKIGDEYYYRYKG